MRFDILLIILAGVFLRLYRIQDFYMFLADQGRDAVIIRRIILLEKFPLIGPPSSIGEVFLGPFYYYVVAPFLWLFRSNPIGLAIGVGLLGMALTYLIYHIVKKTVSREVALLLAGMMSVSALFVDIGRFSWNPNLLPVFSFITLSLFFLSLHGKKTVLYSLLFGMFFGLSFQLHHLAALLGVPVALYYLLFLARKRKAQALQVPLIAVGGFALTLLPFALFELRHDFLNMRNLFSLFTKQNVVSSGPLMNRLIDVTTAVVRFAFHIDVTPVIASLVVSVVVLSVLLLNRKKENPFITLHLIAFISLLFALSRVNAQAIPHYFHTLYVSFYLLVAYILIRIDKTKWKLIAVGFGIAFFLFQSRSYYFFFNESSRQYEAPEQIGRQIAQMSQGKRINLTTYPVEFTSRDCYQYYVELYGGDVVDGSSNEVTDSLYVLCDKEPCRIINSDSWNIQMFGDAKIDTITKRNGISIYELSHK